MADAGFRTPGGVYVPAVTADEMREVDRLAVEDVGLELKQMMENAGRTLAWHVRTVGDGPVLVVAGNGGNGGGGLVCARHLANRDIPVRVVVDRPPEELTGVTAQQHGVLSEMDIPIRHGPDEFDETEARVVVDALIGYGLRGEVRQLQRALIEAMTTHQSPVVSLDIPSGIDATTGERLGAAVTPTRTVTLALPKAGLRGREESLVLADISIPSTVYERLGIDYTDPFGERPWAQLRE